VETEVTVAVDLNDKVAIVTGSVTGFGNGIARWLAKAGAAVVIADINGEGAAKAAAEFQKDGLKAKAVEVNVGNRAQVDAMVNTAVSSFGGVDIMVNNAGYAQTYGPLLDVDEEEFDRIFQVNVKSIFHTTKAVVPQMRKRGGGVIINTASTAGPRPRPGLTWYNASKGAVITLTKSMALELAGDKIRVNALCPTAGATPMFYSKFFKGQDAKAIEDMLLKTIPLGRMVDPDDMGAAVLYLASPAASFITGVCLDVDGGRSV
jgi:3-oxoacyl-[acyl-carrier protein] reductase